MGYTIDLNGIDVRTIGNGIIASYPFVVSDMWYVCWFTELTVDLESVEDTVREISEDGVYESGENTFKVDFDIESNFRRYDENELFIIPKGGYGNSISDLKDITSAISEIVQIHQEIYGCVFYFAEPASRRHDVLYRRYIVPNLEASGYSYYKFDEDHNEGNTYIFLKEIKEGEDHG